MSDGFWSAAAITMSLLSSAWLALSMEVHWTQVMCRQADITLRPHAWMRGWGLFAAMLSLSACLMADRPSMAVLVWLMLLTGSALAIAMVLTYAAPWLEFLAKLGQMRTEKPKAPH